MVREAEKTTTAFATGGLAFWFAQTKKGQGADFHLLCPAALPLDIRQQARELAVKAFAVLRCRDWARVDMRLDENGEPHILEVNTIPGFSPSSSFFAAARAAGFKDMDEVVLHLVDTAIRRYQQNTTLDKS